MTPGDRVVLTRDWLGRLAGMTGTVLQVTRSANWPRRAHALVHWDGDYATAWMLQQHLHVLPAEPP